MGSVTLFYLILKPFEILVPPMFQLDLFMVHGTLMDQSHGTGPPIHGKMGGPVPCIHGTNAGYDPAGLHADPCNPWNTAWICSS